MLFDPRRNPAPALASADARRIPPGKADVDLLTDGAMAESIHRALLGLGYTCLHRSADAGNYQRTDERVDLIYAHNRETLDMDEVREYFRLFGKEQLLQELMG
jgi:hypothetical protein